MERTEIFVINLLGKLVYLRERVVAVFNCLVYFNDKSRICYYMSI